MEFLAGLTSRMYVAVETDGGFFPSPTFRVGLFLKGVESGFPGQVSEDRMVWFDVSAEGAENMIEALASMVARARVAEAKLVEIGKVDVMTERVAGPDAAKADVPS